MRKVTLLTATALILTAMGGHTLTAQAAPKSYTKLFQNGNRVIVTYGSDCNVQNIFDRLESCLPNITLPGCGLPETEAPENNQPEAGPPEAETPEIDSPETNLPDTNAPGNNDSSNDNTTEENTPNDTPSQDNLHAYVKEIVSLVNAERAKEGLSPVTLDTKVSAAAQVRAKECEQSFSHTRPNGSSFATALKEQNVSYRSAGENIAWGQRSPQEVVTAWMNSAGHRANIMNPNFTTIGVGYYQNAKGVNYWCQLFTR